MRRFLLLRESGGSAFAGMHGTASVKARLACPLVPFRRAGIGRRRARDRRVFRLYGRSGGVNAPFLLRAHFAVPGTVRRGGGRGSSRFLKARIVRRIVRLPVLHKRRGRRRRRSAVRRRGRGREISTPLRRCAHLFPPGFRAQFPVRKTEALLGRERWRYPRLRLRLIRSKQGGIVRGATRGVFSRPPAVRTPWPQLPALRLETPAFMV